MLKGASLIGVISLMAWGLGYFGQPHILARFMAADSVKSIPNARRISMSWMIFCLGGVVALGYFGIAYFAWTGLYEIIPGFILCTPGILIFSRIGSASSATMLQSRGQTTISQGEIVVCPLIPLC